MTYKIKYSRKEKKEKKKKKSLNQNIEELPTNTGHWIDAREVYIYILIKPVLFQSHKQI